MPVKDTWEFIPQEGMVRKQLSTFRDPKGFDKLLNARLVAGQGRIEQTPTFYQATNWNAGTIWVSGASTAETISVPRLIASIKESNGDNYHFVVTDQSIRTGSLQVPVVRQTVWPVAATINTGALLTLNSTGAAAINLGSTLDVEITSSTQFRWRRNGGAWSAAATIGIENSLASGTTLFFLTTTGFTIGHTWSWQRTDNALDPTGSQSLTSLPVYVVGDLIYFADPTGRIMKYDRGAVMTVGYRPIYGTSLVVHQNHLVVGSYSETSVNWSLAQTNVVAISDLSNLDNFFPTDTNEADFYTLVGERILGNVDAGHGVHRVSTIGDVLYAYTPTSIWGSRYGGLPVPYNFVEVANGSFNTSFRGNTFNGTGDFVCGTDGLYFFNGSELRVISDKLNDLFLDHIDTGIGIPSEAFYQNIDWGFYDYFRREMYFHRLGTLGFELSSAVFLVYQEKTNTWYLRAAGFAAAVNAGCSASSFYLSTITLGMNFGLMIENLLGINAPLKDWGNGGSFQLPTIISEDIRFFPLVQYSEQNKAHLDAFYTTASIHSDFGQTGVEVGFSLREYIGSTPSYTTHNWIVTNRDGVIPWRGAGRVFKFKITPTVSTGKTTFRFNFNCLCLIVQGLTELHR